MVNKFIQALQSGRVMLMDGAMGTELFRAGLQPGECGELWNLTHPDRVLAIHRAYIEAGAEVLLTNTFQANPAALGKHGLEPRLDEICIAAVELCRQAAGQQGFVLGDIGPSSGDATSHVRSLRAFHQCDGVLLETFSSPADATLVDAATLANVPVLLSITFRRDDKGHIVTHPGLSPESVANEARKLAIVALGVNCGREIDMDDIIEIIRRYRSVTDLPLFARPNAGTPIKVDGQWVYPRTPEQMASKLPELLEAGATMIGGCCGTTPAHIAAFKGVLKNWKSKT